MNRAEIRRQAKELDKDPVRSIKESELKKMIEEACIEAMLKSRNKIVEDVTRVVTDMMLVYSFVALHDQFGFGTKRLMQFKDHVDVLADDISDSRISNMDLIEVCEGLKIDVSEITKRVNKIEGVRK